MHYNPPSLLSVSSLCLSYMHTHLKFRKCININYMSIGSGIVIFLFEEKRIPFVVVEVGSVI